MNAARPAWQKVLFGIVAISAVVFMIDWLLAAQQIKWVGGRDLEITFLITDADTNEPIAGAEIAVPESRSSFCEDCNLAFKLITDERGMAKRMCKNCMCFGTSGSKRFFRRLETFSSHTPDWVFMVSADGFQASGPISIEELAFRQTIQRGDKFATMQVSWMLRRLPKRE